MPNSSSSSKLQRKIILFSAAGIFVISTVVAAVSITPLYQRLISEQEKNLSFTATTKTMAVEEFLTRAKDIVHQITTRTKLRQKLEEYNAGETSLEELLPFSRTALGDALSATEEVRGITRLDKNGHRVIQLGIEIPENLWTIPEYGSTEILVTGPVTLNGQQYLVIGAPILAKDASRAGTDIALFDPSKLIQIVEDYSGLGATGETVIGIMKNDQIIPLTHTRQSTSSLIMPLAKNSDLANSLLQAINHQAGIINPSQNANEHYVIAYHPIDNKNWGMAVKMDADELYESIKHQLITTALWIFALIISGVTGMFFLLRPLAGKIIMQTSELELEIKEKTSAVIEKEAHLRSIVNTAADGILSIDENGNIELFNPAAEKIFGYPSTEVIGLNIRIFMPESYPSLYEDYLDNDPSHTQKTTATSLVREVEGVRKDGTAFPMELTVSELLIQGRRKFTGVVRDITKRRQAQEELKKRYEDLKSANENLKSAQGQLLQSEKMASIGQLAAGVAH